MSRTQRAAMVLSLNLCWVTYGAATTVLVYVSPQEAVIAADSLSNRIEGGQRHVCKMTQVSEHMLFVASGTGATENPHFDPYGLARTSSSNNASPHTAALKYVSDSLATLQEIWRTGRSRYFEIAGINGHPKGPQSFTFVGSDSTGVISASGTSFVEDASTPAKLRVDELTEFAGKNPDDLFLYRAGIYDSVPSDATINDWINTVGAPAALKRAIEMQIKATPDLVGGEISIVRLSRDGSIQWVNRGECK